MTTASVSVPPPTVSVTVSVNSYCMTKSTPAVVKEGTAVAAPDRFTGGPAVRVQAYASGSLLGSLDPPPLSIMFRPGATVTSAPASATGLPLP
ncbi:MAG: hypothetical protein ABIF71_12060 [Planctomycetota bacterium]